MTKENEARSSQAARRVRTLPVEERDQKNEIMADLEPSIVFNDSDNGKIVHESNA